MDNSDNHNEKSCIDATENDRGVGKNDDDMPVYRFKWITGNLGSPSGKVGIIVTGANFLDLDVKICVHSWTASECDLPDGSSGNLSLPREK